MPIRTGWLVAAACWTLLVSLPAAAEESVGIATMLEDVREYFTAPIRWDVEDWSYFGVTVVAAAATHEFDSDVRRHFALGSKALLTAKDKNSARDALPAVALIGGTWAAAGYMGDPDGYGETWRLLESGVLSSVTAEALTFAVGRQRPDATTSPNRWGKGGDSFPSVHSTAAFAIGMTFAESGNDDYRWVRRLLGYGVAAGTAYIRVKDNVHWASDTVAGAAIGIATARFVLNREHGNHSELGFEPQRGGGWMISWTVALH